MTVLVGVRCTDGVVVGADSVATSSMGVSPLIHLQSNSKIRILGKVILAATGAVGLSQRLDAHIQEAISGGVFNMSKLRQCAANISKRLLTDFEQSKVQLHPQLGLRFGALVASVHSGEPFLVEYDTANFQPEFKEENLFSSRWDQDKRRQIPSWPS